LGWALPQTTRLKLNNQQDKWDRGSGISWITDPPLFAKIQEKGGKPMAIKWSAVRVSEAMDKAEELINKAEIPLKLAKLEVTEARKIPNLPQYMDTRLISLISQIERIDNVKSALQAIRDDIPQADLEKERELAEYGSQQTLV